MSKLSPDLLERYKVKIDWDVIYIGWKWKLVSAEEVVRHALRSWEGEPSREDDALTSLALSEGLPEETVDARLDAFFAGRGGPPAPDSPRWTEAVRRWRCARLLECRHNAESNLDLLYCIESVYAEFSYPDDMNNLILFAGPTDGFDVSKHTREECEARLKGLIDAFIENEARQCAEVKIV